MVPARMLAGIHNYPSLHVAVMLVLLAALTLNSASCERSASALHSHHAYLRCNKLSSDYHPCHSFMCTTLTAELVSTASVKATCT